MRQSGQTQPDLGYLQPLANPHQDAVIIQRQSIENQLTMAAVFFRPHDADPPVDMPARLITVKQERRQTAANIITGFGQEGKMLGLGGTGDIPFAAIDDPFAIALYGCCLHHGRVGPAPRGRFGHGKGRPHIPLDDRVQPAGFLLITGQFVQHVHIAVIRRSAIETDGTENRIIHRFIERGHADRTIAETTLINGNLGRP